MTNEQGSVERRVSSKFAPMPDIEVKNRIIKICSEQLGVAMEDLSMEKDLVQDFGADSLDLVEFVMAIEDEFRMEISDEDAAKFRTMQDVYDYAILNRKS